MDYIKEAGKRAKGKRPNYYELPESDRLMGMVMALTTELAVARERADTLERLLEAKGVLSKAEIEAFMPNKAEAEERALMHQDLLSRVFRVIQQERESIEAMKNGEVEKPLEKVSEALGVS